LSEIGHKHYSGEGVSGAHLLRTVWRKSKKNQFGKVQQNALLRHSSVISCPFGTLALYFFYRFHIQGDPWPDFSEASHWYDLYVLPHGIRSDRPMTYAKQHQAIKAAQAAQVAFWLAITTKTQVGRKSGASLAENMGASEASVDKNGHWQVRSRGGAYTNNVVPWECVRVLAGFSPEPKQYYLPRTLLDPPTSLRKLIFPSIETSQQQITASLTSGSRKTEIAGRSFLNLVDHMRTVILQDAAVLIAEHEQYASHSVFRHYIFSSEEFMTFAAELTRKISSTASPASIDLMKTLPTIGGHLFELTQQASIHSMSLTDLEKKIQFMSNSMNQQSLTFRSECLELIGSIFTRLGNGFTSHVSSI